MAATPATAVSPTPNCVYDTALIADARQRNFSVVLVAAFDRVARSVKHFLQVMDEFDALGITF